MLTAETDGVEHDGLPALVAEQLQSTSLRLKPRDPKCPAFASVKEYVSELGGKRIIARILIANNGISAVKAIRSIRQWAYEVFENDRKVGVNVLFCILVSYHVVP